MLSFGSGNFYGIAAGATVATPRKFGVLQDVTFDITASTKALFGQSQFPVDIRRGELKFTGKAKFAQINAGIVNDLFFNQSSSTGVLLSAVGESAQIPASTPWTVTVVNSATFDTDLGVVYAATGQAFIKVSGTPTIGEYSECRGVRVDRLPIYIGYRGHEGCPDEPTDGYAADIPGCIHDDHLREDDDHEAQCLHDKQTVAWNKDPRLHHS